MIEVNMIMQMSVIKLRIIVIISSHSLVFHYFMVLYVYCHPYNLVKITYKIYFIMKK